MRRPARAVLALLVAGLPVLLICAADLPLVPAAESRLEQELRSRVKAASVDAQIGAFPVVGRAALLGEVASVDIEWTAAKVGAVEAVAARLSLDGVGFDRSSLFDGKVSINGVESGEIRVLVSASELTRLLGREVFIEAGKVQAQLTPTTRAEVRISATNRGLVLAASELEPVSVDLGVDTFPCAPTAEIDRGNVRLQCSFRGTPPVLRPR